MISFLFSFFVALLNGGVHLEIDRGTCNSDECIAPAIEFNWIDTQFGDSETDFIIINSDGSIATGP